MKARSDPYLKKLYRTFNKKYFSNSLPKDIVVRWLDSPSQKVEECDSKSVVGCANAEVMWIDRRYQKLRWWTQLKMTMFHEMAHVKLANKRVTAHGKSFKAKFQREMLRLAALGAFIKYW